MTKLVLSRWLDIGYVLFCCLFMRVQAREKNLANTQPYYMASSVSGQDESNPALWLATRALSCPLRTTCLVPQEKFPRKPYNKSFIDQACSVKMAGYWPRSFFACLWTSTPSLSINSQKKRTRPISSHLDRTSLVNNPYILTLCLINDPYMVNTQPRSQRAVRWETLGTRLRKYSVCGGTTSSRNGRRCFLLFYAFIHFTTTYMSYTSQPRFLVLLFYVDLVQTDTTKSRLV